MRVLSNLPRLLLATALLVIGAVALTAPGIASASSVSVSGGQLKLKGQGQEFNAFYVAVDGANYKVEEFGGQFQVRSGCTSVDEFTATCPIAGVTAISATVGANDDDVTLEPEVTVPAKIVGGSGYDFLEGGSGPDQILGGSSEDTIYGGGAGDSINGGAGEDLVITDDDAGAVDTIKCTRGDFVFGDPTDIFKGPCEVF